jgi:phosphoribosylglycinamide formyltransferase-1
MTGAPPLAGTPPLPEPKRLGILLSGRGSNFMAIADSAYAGKLEGKAEIACVISNVAGAEGLLRARAMEFPTGCYLSKGRNRAEQEAEVIASLRESEVDLVVLAGYMRLLSPEFIAAFPNQILNVHPSLLPAFPGLDAQKQALDHGVKITGCTVHFVDEFLDSGPVVIQSAVPVLDTDTHESLSARILAQEHVIYSQAIQYIAEGRVSVEGRLVRIKEEDAE